MSDYPDWQADNEPMRAALARLHHLQRTMGQVVPEAKEQFFAALQEAYFLVPNQGDIEDDETSDSPSFSFFFEPIEGGLMLSVFSSVDEARAFWGEEENLRCITQSAPDFFGSVANIAEALEESGEALAGVVLDRASENFYFFEVPELISLSAGGRVIGPAQQVSIENQQIQVSALPENTPLTQTLIEAFQEVMSGVQEIGVRELWAFWLTIDGQHEHLGLALVSEQLDAIGHVGPLLEEKWQTLGPKYAAFDLMPLVGPQEAAIRANGRVLWRYEPPAPPKRPFWHFLKP